MKFDIAYIKEFIESQGPDTRIYIGVDSERIRGADKQWQAVYTAAIVVHINGNNGCKLFGEVSRERDYDRVDRPNTRLMTEVYKVAEMYLDLSAIVENDIEVHLDINPNEMYNSSIVINEAIGYIKGMCNVVPMVKPKAFAASYAADRLKGIAA
jgi:predicted RNase H-related nuclease YkuK (DUF458 family)